MKTKMPFYRQSWFKSAIQAVVGLLVFYLLYISRQAPLVAWWVDILAFGVVFALSLALMSQFILPVTTTEERRQAFSRLQLYVAGKHGPIVFVRNGEMIASISELKRLEPGVMLADSTSGAVLELGMRFTRAVGPGITFLEAGEQVKQTLDLRKQLRRVKTEALTRDGIEIETTLTVVFGLTPGEQRDTQLQTTEESDLFLSARILPAYPFNPSAAFKAVYGAAVSHDRTISWADLPTIVASETFRDLVVRRDLDDLFAPNDPEARPMEALAHRLTEGLQKSSLLHERGVRVYAVEIGLIEMPPKVQQQLIATWRAHWQSTASKTRNQGEAMAEQIKEQARAAAQREILSEMANSLQQTFSNDGKATKTEIARRLIAELSRAAADPVVRLMLPADVVNELNSMRHWAGLALEDDLPTKSDKPSTQTRLTDTQRQDRDE